MSKSINMKFDSVRRAT